MLCPCAAALWGMWAAAKLPPETASSKDSGAAPQARTGAWDRDYWARDGPGSPSLGLEFRAGNLRVGPGLGLVWAWIGPGFSKVWAWSQPNLSQVWAWVLSLGSWPGQGLALSEQAKEGGDGGRKREGGHGRPVRTSLLPSVALGTSPTPLTGWQLGSLGSLHTTV